jgi:hypothetical protein
MGKKIKADIEYSFEHGEVIHYSLYGVSIHPVNSPMQASFLTQLPERKKTAQFNTEFKTCVWRNLRMDHQHCSYSTILT